MQIPATEFDVKTLQTIRALIITALVSIDLKIVLDYKLSAIDYDNPSLLFRIEIINRSATPTRIKNILRKNFTCVPTYKDSPDFIRVNTEGEYLYLLGQKIQQIAAQ